MMNIQTSLDANLKAKSLSMKYVETCYNLSFLLSFFYATPGIAEGSAYCNLWANKP